MEYLRNTWYSGEGISMEYLRNTWYAVAWSDEVGDQPFGRKVIEEPLALYRTSDGTLHVLRDMCPHRFATLSKGKIVSDPLQCPYHGLRFASHGKCVFNPQDRKSKRLNSSQYCAD